MDKRILALLGALMIIPAVLALEIRRPFIDRVLIYLKLRVFSIFAIEPYSQKLGEDCIDDTDCECGNCDFVWWICCLNDIPHCPTDSTFDECKALCTGGAVTTTTTSTTSTTSGKVCR